MIPNRRDARDVESWYTHAEPVIGPFGVAMIMASIAVVCAGVAWPQAAEALLRVFLATLAIGFVLARAYEAVLPGLSRDHSPFDGLAMKHSPPVAPKSLRGLTHEMTAADDPRSSWRTPIPWSVRRSVRDEVSRRLAERHGLSLGEPAHHAAVRSLVAESTWLLVNDYDDGPDPGTAGDDRSRARHKGTGNPVVPLSQLGEILDDVESL